MLLLACDRLLLLMPLQDLVRALLGCLQDQALRCERAFFELSFAHDACFSRFDSSHAPGGGENKPGAALISLREVVPGRCFTMRIACEAVLRCPLPLPIAAAMVNTFVVTLERVSKPAPAIRRVPSPMIVEPSA